jgi:hypothetical protein
MHSFFPLLKTGYNTISHKLVCAMLERWHEETNNFHLPVGEMTVTLNDVASLLGIPIIRTLIKEEDLSYERDMQLLDDELHFTAEDAMLEVTKQWGVFITYAHLKRCYERLLGRCNQMQEPADEEEAKEQSTVRTACIKAFLLLLLGYTIFVSKNSKSVNLLWLLALQDLDRLGDWSWDGMTLAFLYSKLSLTSDSTVKVVGGYLSLLVVIYFYFYFLVDHK